MAKVQVKVAKRYAIALFRSTEVAKLEQTRDALNSVAQAWSSSKELRDALNNPSVSVKDKVSVAKSLAQAANVNDAILVNFLSLLAENGRISSVARVATIFSALVDEAKKLLNLEITSAFPVEADEQGRIRQAVEKDFGSMASISWSIDKDLIGGLIVKAGDKHLDSSIRGSLEKLQNSLLGLQA